LGGKLEHLVHFFFIFFPSFFFRVINCPCLRLFILSPSYGNPLLTPFQIPYVPLSFLRTLAMESDPTSVDKHITLKSLCFYVIGRHVEENRGTETTKELRNTIIKFCGLHFSQIRLGRPGGGIWYGQEMGEARNMYKILARIL